MIYNKGGGSDAKISQNDQPWLAQLHNEVSPPASVKPNLSLLDAGQLAYQISLKFVKPLYKYPCHYKEGSDATKQAQISSHLCPHHFPAQCSHNLSRGCWSIMHQISY